LHAMSFNIVLFSLKYNLIFTKPIHFHQLIITIRASQHRAKVM
jgi:hypothetical protein